MSTDIVEKFTVHGVVFKNSSAAVPCFDRRMRTEPFRIGSATGLRAIRGRAGHRTGQVGRVAADQSRFPLSRVML